MIRQLAEEIFSIDIPLPGNPLRNLNSFLIKGEKRNLIIDTGFNMPACLKAFNAGMNELEVDIERCDIMLTHLHSDHVGLAPAIAGERSTIYMSGIDYEIFTSFDDPQYIRMMDDKFLQFGFPYKELMENKTANPAMIYRPTRKVRYTLIEDGYTIDLGDSRLECILTPGHTPGHVCLYDNKKKYLFTGDHLLFGISPNITSWPAVDDSLGAYIDSLEKVKSLDVSRAFAAHREIEGDFHTRIDELIRHHRNRLGEAEASVRKRKRATVYEAASDMSWSIRAKNWDAFPAAQKWFALGEAHSHLEYLRVRNIVHSTLENGLMYYSPVSANQET